MVVDLGVAELSLAELAVSSKASIGAEVLLRQQPWARRASRRTKNYVDSRRHGRVTRTGKTVPATLRAPPSAASCLRCLNLLAVLEGLGSH